MANAKIIEKKQEVVNEIVNKVNESSTFVLFEYQGLTVSDMTELRRKLREAGSDLKIYKNTLTRRALNSINIDMDAELAGPKAMAYGTDAIAPIKVLSDFAKTHEALQMKIGMVDGEIADIDTLKKYASIPSRDGLLTMFAGGLMQTVRDFAICLDLHSQNLEKENN